MNALNWMGLVLVVAVLMVTAVGGMVRTEEAPPVPAEDPTRNPNWCWTHQQMWPACAGQHEEK